MKEHRLSASTIERWAIRFEGIVQGVGFRPLVSVCAHELGLTGFVYNDGAGVYVEAQGHVVDLKAFVKAIQDRLPRLGRINNVEHKIIDPVEEEAFSIRNSPLGGPIHTFIPPDTAPCQACLEEMHQGVERRINYSFINCTNCGPRYTIIESMPYDRERTTMSDFPMCPDCQAEYEDIRGRRYHAEPNACHVCGPHYSFYRVDRQALEKVAESCHEGDQSWNSDWGLTSEKPETEHRGSDMRGCHGMSTHDDRLGSDDYLLFEEEGDASLLSARDLVKRGGILALKGIGGYHLVCDAHERESIQILRDRKHRPAKPLALMAGSLKAIKEVAQVSPQEEELLLDPSRPIVLLALKKNVALPMDVIAPGTHYIGIMLPYAPIHEALLPKEALWIMTSGNRSGDPVLFKDDQAIQELASIVDGFLLHNRRIEAPVDDSVMAIGPQGPLQFRRSRGFVPAPIYIPSLGNHTVLAMGSDLKNAFALNCGHQALMGPHMGDLASAKSHQTLEWTIDHYEKLFNLNPTHIVVDSHPGYFSSALGRKWAKERNLLLLDVQHHHAHIGAVMAEHDIDGKVLGICFDGTGYGPDGTMWGGEFLVCQGASYKRMAHLKAIPLLGGEAAVREPWRQAVYYLDQTYGKAWPENYLEWAKTLPKGWELVQSMAHSSMNLVMSSGAGRLFDALGSLLGQGNVHAFDGQIAMSLEQLAHGHKGHLVDFYYDQGVLDMGPTVAYIMDEYAKGTSRKRLAASFHRTLAFAMVEVAKDICQQEGIKQVVLAGGVFQNRRLLEEFLSIWDGKPVLMNKLIPPNDGGLALGQLYIAHQLIKKAN